MFKINIKKNPGTTKFRGHKNLGGTALNGPRLRAWCGPNGLKLWAGAYWHWSTQRFQP